MLNPNITLAGDLGNYRLEGDDIEAMNELYKRIVRQEWDFLSGLDSDARIGNETGLRHWTGPATKRVRTGSKRTVVFRAGYEGGVWTMTVYAYGQHYGDDNKTYRLFTFENGKKAKLYRF
jgi:hypothetical protein